MANLDFKQVSHITAEILLIGGISYYLNSRCTVLQARINEDREKIISHEKRIEELEAQLAQVLSLKSAPVRQAAPKPRVAFQSKPPSPAQEPVKTVESMFFRSTPTADPPAREPVKPNDNDSGFPNDDMDSIDAELHDELAELEEEQEDA